MADCPVGTALPDFMFPTQPAYGGQNGRINFTASVSAGGSLSTNFTGFDYEKKAEPEFVDDMTRGNWEQNSLSTAFFSGRNIDIIQNAIRSDVYKRSGDKQWVIDPQSVDELKIIMRAQYLTYGKNLEQNIPAQVAELNKLVIDWIVPRVMSEVQHHFFYLKDVATLPVPISHPVLMSSAGTKTAGNGSYWEKNTEFPF
jgi:hypothetical protein